VATHNSSKDYSLSNLLENQFGNYVIQHALMLADADRKQVLYEKIEQAATQGHVDRAGQFAKHVYSLIETCTDLNPIRKAKIGVPSEETKSSLTKQRVTRMAADRQEAATSAIGVSKGVAAVTVVEATQGVRTAEQPMRDSVRDTASDNKGPEEEDYKSESGDEDGDGKNEG